MNANMNASKITGTTSQEELFIEPEMDETEEDLLDEMLTERKLNGHSRGGPSSSIANIATFYGESDCDWS